jgi:hypothetical protein
VIRACPIGSEHRLLHSGIYVGATQAAAAFFLTEASKNGLREARPWLGLPGLERTKDQVSAAHSLQKL